MHWDYISISKVSRDWCKKYYNLHNQADIMTILPTQELVSKFHDDWVEIVYFFIEIIFLGSDIFLHQSLCTLPNVMYSWQIYKTVVFSDWSSISLTLIILHNT